MLYVRACFFVFALGLLGCAAQSRQADQLLAAAQSHMAAGETVQAVDTLLLTVREASSPAVTSGKRLLADPALGRQFETAVTASVSSRGEFLRSLDRITDLATYNAHIKGRQTELSLALCRAVTPKIHSGEIPLTAASGNIPACLQDRDYVEAVFNASLASIGTRDTPQETQALSQLVADAPFPDLAERLKKELPKAGQAAKNIQTAKVEAEKEAAKQAEVEKTTGTESEAASAVKKVCVRVFPKQYDFYQDEFKSYLCGSKNIRYVENADDPDVLTVYVQVDMLNTSIDIGSSEFKKYGYYECDEKMQKIMGKDDDYMYFYDSKKNTASLRGVLTMKYGNDIYSSEFSHDIEKELIDCYRFSIYRAGDDVHTREYANSEMEKLCTQNKVPLTEHDVMMEYIERTSSLIIEVSKRI